MPTWLNKYDYNTQKKFIEIRVRNLVARFGKTIDLWDAVNEMLWEPLLQNLPNRQWPHIEPVNKIAEYCAEIIGWARSENPSATYLINEYGIEGPPIKTQQLIGSGGQVVDVQFQRQRYIALIDQLKQIGASPNAMGIQSHSGGNMYPLEQAKMYDQFTKARTPIHITEFWSHIEDFTQAGVTLVPENGDFVLKDISGSGAPLVTLQQAEELRNKYVTNYLKVAFAHPAVDAFFFWGFLGDALIERSESFKTTSYYDTVKNLIKTEWHTKTTAVTNANGEATFRGFNGEYLIKLDDIGPYSAPGAKIMLSPKSDNFHLVLPI